MKAQDFRDWMDATGNQKAIEVADSLGLSRNVAQRIVADVKAGEDIEVKRTVQLAMSAVAQKLKPWGDYQR